MCGIAGVYAYHYAANPIRRSELAAMSEHMASRGPDGSGIWLDSMDRIGVVHRRLAVIDLSDRAAQPMSSSDGRYVIVFNGEIYNYRQLRDAMGRAGAQFRTHSDTEVLLYLYAMRGAGMVEALRGMFAFAIYDTFEKTIFLARDPFGIKPLYYSDDGWIFRFASQVKTLLAGGAISRDQEPAGHVGFYLFGSVPEPYTCYRAIRTLPAGSTLLVDCAGAQPARRYYSVAAVYGSAVDKDRCDGDIGGHLREGVLDSVRHHLVSDVGVGAFLSAGLDSGALVGLMRDAGARDIQTVTVGFAEFADTAQDETPLAAHVARLYGTRHTTRIVTQTEFEADLPHIFTSMDQPSIDGVNVWFAAKAARELGLKVVLSGLGGDELLGGYPSFRDVPRWASMLWLPSRVPLLGAATRGLADVIASRLRLHPKLSGLIQYGGSYAGAYLLKRGLYLPSELDHVLDREIVREGLRRLSPLALIGAQLGEGLQGSFARVASLESGLYLRNQLLRDADWASMAHSVEVRTPLVDSTLLSHLAAIDRRAHSSKALLARAPSLPLPETLLCRAKTGFVTPVAAWMASRAGKAPTDRRAMPSRLSARAWSRTVHAQFPFNA